MRIAIFASGFGSNAQNLWRKAKLFTNVEVSFILTDQPQAKVIEKCSQENLQYYIVEKKSTQKNHEEEILNLIKKHQIDWIFLAGYMRILSKDFLQSFSMLNNGENQIVNIHPSYLPAYKGAHAIEEAFRDKPEHSGVTVHFVDAGMDTGPIILQEKVPLYKNDELSDFKIRIQAKEAQLYPKVLEMIVNNKVGRFYEENTSI